MIEPEFIFKHEKQNAYLLAIKFISWKTLLFDDCSNLKDEEKDLFVLLDKGGLSVLFYTLEGNEKPAVTEKNTLFEKAILAAKECSSCLDALVAHGIFNKSRVSPGKKILIGIAALLEDKKARFKHVSS